MKRLILLIAFYFAMICSALAQQTFPPVKEFTTDGEYSSIGGFDMNDSGILTVYVQADGEPTILRGNKSSGFEVVTSTNVSGVVQIGFDPVINEEGDVAVWKRLTNGQRQIDVHFEDGSIVRYLDTSGFLTDISNTISLSNHFGPSPIVVSRSFFNGGQVLARSDGSVTITIANSNGDLDSFSSVYSDPQGLRSAFVAEEVSSGDKGIYIHQGSSVTNVLGVQQGFLSVSASSINSLGRVGFLAIKSGGLRELGVAWQGGFQVYANDQNIDLFTNPIVDNDNSLWVKVRNGGVDEIRRITASSMETIVRVGDQFADGTSITSLDIGRRGVTEFGLVFKAELNNGQTAVCVAPKHDSPQLEDRVEPSEVSPTLSKVVFVTHGHTPDPDAAEIWVNQMVASIDSQVGGEWEVLPLLWTHLSDNGLSGFNESYYNGVAFGINTANQLLDLGHQFDEISLKGNSASAGLMDAFCRAIKQRMPSTRISVEVFDGYELPGPGFLQEADFSMHYFTDGPLASGDVPFTNSPFPNSHNVNVTLLDGLASHDFPRAWYQETITAAYQPSWLVYGWRFASPETGNANTFVFPQDGRTVSLVDSWFEFNSNQEVEGNDIDFAETASTTSSTGEVTGNGATLTLQTQSPAWWLGLIDLTTPRNYFEFDVDFLSSNSQGQLVVEFDGEVVCRLDERFVTDGRFRVPLFDSVQGAHQIGIRLDSFTSQTSMVQLENLRFGTSSIIVEQFVERGDMDGSGVVNNADINPFVLALIDRDEYEETYPELDPDINGDMNSDGSLNFADINLFVDKLLQ